MSATLLLLVTTLTPWFAALLIGSLKPADAQAARWAVRAAGLAWASAAGLVIVIALQGPRSVTFEVAATGPAVGLHADRVGAVLAMLTTGVGFVVLSYCARALQGDPRARRFVILASILTGATTTTALAATLGVFTVGWVLAGRALVALVTHRNTWVPARRAARMTSRYLAVGDVALIAAAGLVIASLGEVDLRAVDAAATVLSVEQVAGINPLPLIAVLLTIAGVSRSALVPLHRWLPATVAAPTPVSAMLHAGVVNGAGVLLVTLAPIFAASTLATRLLLVLGLVTIAYATTVMLTRADVKGALAWSTAGQMGFMAVQLAVGAFAAALFHLIGHGMYKAALFLGSGGAITAHLRHHRRPHPLGPVPRPLRLAVSLGAPGIALLMAYQLIDPHLPPAGDLLVVVFAWATAARAADGWLRAAPFGPWATATLATAGVLAAIVTYVGGLALVEGFLIPALAPEVATAVGPGELATALAVVGLVALAVRFAPGVQGTQVRRWLYAALLSTSAPTHGPSERIRR